MNSATPIPDAPLAFAHGGPAMRGVLRTTPEDFQVDEDLGFAPDGDGQHVLLRVRKKNTNTDWLARELAKFAGVEANAVSYAGLKDRAAVTTQWFSVDLAGRPEPEWARLNGELVQVLEAARHRRKLKRGSLRGNQFQLVLRQLSGDRSALQTRLEKLRDAGMPNYFGEQRFGRDGDNLRAAEAMFAGTMKIKDRHRRGLYISAARSLLFNHVLAARVAAGLWNVALPGDALMLDGSHSFFIAEALDDDVRRRVAAMDVHPTGPLWGRGTLPTLGEARELELAVLSDMEVWRMGLEHVGLSQERRALRVPLRELAWEWSADDALTLRFKLPAGAYATSVVRELVDADTDRPLASADVVG